MNRTDVLLVDASVWVAAGDPEERFHSASRGIALDFDRPVAGMDLTLYEVANAMGVRKRQPEAARYLAQVVIARCGDSLIAVDSDLIDSALRVAAEHGLTAYDAAYVAAAQRYGWTLVSTDVADLVSRDLAVTPDAVPVD